jgi:hypothetical protein
MRRFIFPFLVSAVCGCVDSGPDVGSEPAGNSVDRAPPSTRDAAPATSEPPLSIDSVATSLGQVDAIDSLDFNLAGLTPRTDSADVRRILGSPDSIVVEQNPVGDGTHVSWLFPQVRVQFHADSLVRSVLTGDSTYVTHRGIRVGDSAIDVLRAYGPQEGSVPTNWVYADPMDPDRMHLIHFYIRDGVVDQILMGWALD